LVGQLIFDLSVAEQFDSLYRTRDMVRRRELVRDALEVNPGDLGRRLERGVLALVGSRSDGAGIAGLGRAPRSPVVASDAGRTAAIGGLRRHPYGGPCFRDRCAGSRQLRPRVFHFITQFVTGRCGLTADDVAAWVAEQRQLDQRGEFFFACVQFCFSATSARAEQSTIRYA
jgi:hypothetical protein